MTCSSSRRRCGVTISTATPSWSSTHRCRSLPASGSRLRLRCRRKPDAAERAAAHDLKVVPHGWKTGITVAATAHLAAITPQLPFFEFVPPDVAESRLRRELVADELSLDDDGTLALPERPGLGIELNRDALEEFGDAAARLAD